MTDEIKQKHKEWLEQYSNNNLRYLIARNKQDVKQVWKLNYVSNIYNEEINLIEIPDNLLIIEFDEESKQKNKIASTKEQRDIWTNETIEKLKKEHVGFSRYSHKGKSDHIHIPLDRIASKEEKEAIIKHYIPTESLPFVDLSLCGVHLISVPYAKHWKYGTYKLLVEEQKGRPIKVDEIGFVNSTIPVSLNVSLPEFNIITVALKYGIKKGKSSPNWYCPFHNDENPSLSLDQEKNIFNCFGCNKHGHLLTFIEELELIDEMSIIKKYDEFCYIVKNLYHVGYKYYIKLGQEIIVKYLSKYYTFLTPKDSLEIFVYHEGIFRPIGETIIAEEVQKILRNENSNKIVVEIIGHIKRSTFIEREDFIEPNNMICLKNGIFNFDSMQLESFSPSYIFLNKIPVFYDSKKDCPKIKKFIHEVFIPRDKWELETIDNSDIITFQEFVGYFLYKNVRFNRAVMLYGNGENGKSTMINLIKCFLGEKNVANVPIQKLERDKFSVSSLFGKLANLHSDLPKAALSETSVFKQLTGGDAVDAEKKFKDNFSFTSYAKMMFAANTLPATYDDTRAFWRRWIMFKFPNYFSEVERLTNKNLLKELTTKEELSGFLNWAIVGLKRLLQNERFTMNKGTEEIRIEYIRKSDSVGAFILDCIEEVVGEWITKKDLYEAYAEYCRKYNYDMLENNTFHKVFHKKVRVREYNPIQGKKQVKSWTGVRLKLDIELPSEDKINLDD